MAELDAGSPRRRRIGVSIATATVGAVVLLVLRLCGPGGLGELAERDVAEPAVLAWLPGIDAEGALLVRSG